MTFFHRLLERIVRLPSVGARGAGAGQTWLPGGFLDGPRTRVIPVTLRALPVSDRIEASSTSFTAQGA